MSEHAERALVLTRDHKPATDAARHQAALFIAQQDWPADERLEVLRMLGLADAGFRHVAVGSGHGVRSRRRVETGSDDD